MISKGLSILSIAKYVNESRCERSIIPDSRVFLASRFLIFRSWRFGRSLKRALNVFLFL